MARGDLRDELHQQVVRSIAAGAKLLLGGDPVQDLDIARAASLLIPC